MKISYLILLFALIQSAVFGQGTERKKLYVEGRIISEVNNKPLENVITYLQKERVFIATDSTGFFRIPVKASGEHRLIVIEGGYSELDSLIVIKTESLTDLNIVLVADCPFNRSSAEKDIKKGNPKLLLVGSIAPVVYTGQNYFERKYKVQYYDFGCTPPADACIEEYNQKVFEFLDKKYGDKWRKEVRKDVRFLSKTK
ncbi:hypothetical protein [uncultured Pontibacter sp.]|uniref:FEKKY domain-containing protein n=1 Tax=uncultured Pontibacter sp. TaxID=453356 RepID=UPI00260E6C8C|nr:hypothetical protein [uncultured Pontibacter sp.]